MVTENMFTDTLSTNFKDTLMILNFQRNVLGHINMGHHILKNFSLSPIISRLVFAYFLGKNSFSMDNKEVKLILHI